MGSNCATYVHTKICCCVRAICFISSIWLNLVGFVGFSKILQVVVSPTHYLFQIYRNGVTFLVCTQMEMPPLMAIEVWLVSSNFFEV
jgi:hypothetical protein